MSRTRTWLRRAALAVSTALALVLLPAVAYAADEKTPTAGTSGGTVSATTGVIAVLLALWLSWKRGALLLVLLGIAAGTMLSGTNFAGTLSDMADQLIRAAITAASGIFV